MNSRFYVRPECEVLNLAPDLFVLTLSQTDGEPTITDPIFNPEVEI